MWRAIRRTSAYTQLARRVAWHAVARTVSVRVAVQAAADSIVGLVLEDKYRVLREVGRGGMGVVYEAEHTLLGKRVAIKLMLEKYSEDTEAITRFKREAFAASRIGNPHIIDVMDIGTAPDGRSFVVMELLSKGMPLSTAIEARGAMPMWRAVHIMRQVLRAVGAAHAKGIVHRDLKPDNIFLLRHEDQQDFVKLLDFGISKIIDADEASAATKLTTTGVVIGTPLYMAPEQAMGSTVERFADIYACGVMLYEMLAGRPPFEGPNYAVLIAKVLTSDAPLLSEVRTGLPPKLVAAVHRALEKEPAARFRTAEEFALALPSNKSSSQIELAGTMESGRRPSAPALSTLGSSAGAMAVPVSLHAAGPAPRSKRWIGLAALGMIAAGAITFGAVTRGSRSATTTDVGAAHPPGATATPIAPVAGAGAAETTGTLLVETTPSAMITIDGTPRGPSPVEITLDPGDHEVKIDAPGYTAVAFKRQVRAGAPTRVAMTLVAATALPPLTFGGGTHGSKPRGSTSHPVAPGKVAPGHGPPVIHPTADPTVTAPAGSGEPGGDASDEAIVIGTPSDDPAPVPVTPRPGGTTAGGHKQPRDGSKSNPYGTPSKP